MRGNGSIMAITPWLHYADPTLAPLCRSPRGSNVPISDSSRTFMFFSSGYWLESGERWVTIGWPIMPSAFAIGLRFGNREMDSHSAPP